MLESVYQSRLIKKLKRLFPGCVILKNDTDYLQGIPDLLILWQNYWGMLEVKVKPPRSSRDFEPNQEWWIDKLNTMSFAACIYPANEEDVLDALQRSFRPRRSARVSVR